MILIHDLVEIAVLGAILRTLSQYLIRLNQFMECYRIFLDFFLYALNKIALQTKLEGYKQQNEIINLLLLLYMITYFSYH